MRRRGWGGIGLVSLILCGWGGAAAAQTANYNFTFSSSGGTVSGVFGVQNGNVIAASGSSAGFPDAYFNGTITALLPHDTYDNNDNKFYVPGPYLDVSGVSFRVGSNPVNLYRDSGVGYELEYAGDAHPFVANDLTVTAAPGPLPGSGLLSWLFAGLGLLVWGAVSCLRKTGAAGSATAGVSSREQAAPS